MTTSTPSLRGFDKPFRPDADGLLRNLRRAGTPERVYHMELFLDSEIRAAAAARFGLEPAADPKNADAVARQHIALNRLLGYDTCAAALDGIRFQYVYNRADDTAEEAKRSGRDWMEEGTGPIGSWADFERYPWPDVRNLRTDTLDALARNLPDDMCLIGFLGHFCENLVWLFGYQNLCFKLHDDRALVEAVAARILDIELASVEAMVSLERVRIVWHSDDMGFRTGLMFAPEDMRRYVLSGHRQVARRVRESGRISLLHCCGRRTDIIEDLIEDVGFAGIHSFEDTIERVTDAKRAYGDRISLIGGIDVDFLCRADEAAVRRRVRETLAVCQPGGGYALGTGNSVANYIPLGNYLAMLDEGRLHGG